MFIFTTEMKAFLIQNYVWLIFLLLVSVGSISADLINNRLYMSDLEVYHKTAVRMLDGGELYREAEENPNEHYVYKYSPPVAMLFIPFAFTGFAAAKAIYAIMLVFFLGHILYILKNTFLGYFEMNRRITASLIFSIAIVGTHFFRELHLGQVNLLLLWLYVLALRSYQKDKAVWFGVILAISLFIKPFGLIIIPFIIITGRYKELLYTLLAIVILFILPFAFYLDPQSFIGLYGSWLTELSIELGNKQDLLADGNHTLVSILIRYTPLGPLVQNGAMSYVYQLLVLFIIALLILWFLFKRKVEDGRIRIYIVLVALIPLLAFTASNAFIFSLPLILFLMFHFRSLNTFFKVLFILFCLLIGGNIYDLMGRDLHNILWGISIYSWGTVGLLLVLFINWKYLHIKKAARRLL